MYIRFYMKSILLLLFACGAFVGLPAIAQQAGRDSTARKVSLVRWTAQTAMPRVNLVRENVADNIIPALSKGLIKNYLSGLTVGGYYRGFFYNRNMSQRYGTDDAGKHTMSVGDGNYDPTLFLYIGGNPTANTSFGADVIVANPFTIYRGPGYYNNGLVNPYYTAVLRGTITTDVGNFGLIAGGIEWQKLTAFTFGSNTGFNRYSIFERRPWDPVDNIKSRYASYYYSGNINQDTRFGTQAFKGFMLNGFLKNINTNVDVFYGKTAPNSGIQRENVVRPSQNLGVRIKKNLNSSNYISLNTFNSYGRSDSINSSNNIQWNIYTTEFSFRTKGGITLNGEVGAGRYKSPKYPESWSEGIILDLAIPKKYTFIPLDIRYYQIGKSFTSNVANFNNTTISAVNTGYNGAGTSLTTPFGPSLDNVGDLANNRRGIALNTTFKVSRFVISLGTQISGELEKMPNSTTLYYSHRINNLVWSRLQNIFPYYGYFGPDKRTGISYRGAYEKVKLGDTTASGTNQYKKYFNAMDVQVKYKNRLFNRDLYINYLGSFNSVQNQLSAVSKFNDDAYIRAQYHEVDIYYQLHKSFILTFYGGLERIRGNKSTDIGPTGNGRNQTGKAIGVGFDFSISSSTTLFFRQRWFSFDDSSFPGSPATGTAAEIPAEKFSGNEGTVELKIFF